MGTKNYVFRQQYVADFETVHAETEYYKTRNDVEIVYWYAKNIANNLDIGGDEHEGVLGQSFYDFIMSLTKNTTIWFHNLAWDGEFIIPLLLKNGWTMNYCYVDEDEQLVLNNGYYEDNKNKVKLKSKHFDVFQNGNKIYEIICRYKNGKKNIDVMIQFRCSLRLLTTPIKKLAQSYQDVIFLGKPLVKLLEDEEKQKENFYIREPIADLLAFVRNNSDFVDYCKRDVEIARRALIDFDYTVNQLPSVINYQKYVILPKLKKKNHFAKLTSYNTFAKSLTIAGIGRALMKSIYVPNFQKSHPFYYASNVDFEDEKIGNMVFINKTTHQFIKNDENNFYIGAFTQFNPKYQLKKETKDLKSGIKLDVVSAYPYQMTKSLPYGSIMDSSTFLETYGEFLDSWKQGEDYIEFLTIEADKVIPNKFNEDCCVVRNYTNLVDKDLNVKYRYVNKVQRNVKLCLIADEFEELQHWAKFEGLRIEKHYMLAAPFLKDYATEVIAMKTKYSIEKNLAFKQSTKILANAAYGSLGMRLEYDALLQFEKDSNFEKDKKYTTFDVKFRKNQLGTLSGVSKSKNIGDLHAFRFKLENNKSRFFNVAAAAVITALQRVYIWKTIRRIGPQYFAYSDTDSIIFVNYDKKKEKEILALTGNKLGDWEIESNNIKGFGAKKAKDYYIINEKGEIEFKAAGFTNKEKMQELIHAFHFENANEYLNKNLKIENATLKSLKCDSGLVLVSVDKLNKFGGT